MPDIYVNTDNSSLKAKIYKGAKFGKSAAAAEKKMEEVVIEVIGKTPGFTTDKSGKGYTIKIEVTKAEPAGGSETTYTLHPEIVRFPPGQGKGGKGEFMVSTLVKDITITAGRDEGLLLEGVADATQKIVTKSVPGMKLDMGKR